MARIPDAFFEGGFGQKQTQRNTFIPSGPSPGAIVAEGMGNLSNSLLNAGLTLQQKQREEAKAQADEFERRERQRKGAEAQLSLVSHADTLHSVSSIIANDDSLDAQAKRDQFEQQSQNVASALLDPLDEDNKQALFHVFEANRLAAKRELEKSLIIESRDATRALTFASAEVITDSARPLSEKLTLLRDKNLFAGSGLSEVDIQIKREEYINRATAADINGRFNREDPARIKADLSAKEGTEYKAYSWLDPVSRQAYIKTADNMIEQRQRDAENRQKHAATAQNTDAKNAFDIYKNYREAMFPIPPQVEAQLWKRMIGSEYEPLANNIKEQTGSLAFVQGKVNADPLTHGAARLGLMVPPLLMENPAAWPQQLAQREQIGRAIAQEYGLPYTPVLKADEAKALSRTLSIQPPDALLKVVQGFKATGGLKQIAGQIAQEDRSLATVIALAEENPSGAYLVAQGRALVQGGIKPEKDIANSLDSAWKKQAASTLLGMEKMKSDLKNAVDFAYHAKATSLGKNSFDGALYKETMKEVIGLTAKINGKMVFMPFATDEATFKDGFKSAASLTALQSSGGVSGFSSLMAARAAILDDGRLHETETTGAYEVELNGELLMTEDDPTKPLRLMIGGPR